MKDDVVIDGWRATGKIQTYECRLRRSGVLRLSDVGNVLYVHASEQLAKVGQALTRDLPHEQLWIVFLSGKNEIRGALRVSEGGLHGCALRPADILRPVLLSGEGAFALIHNHPSGDPKPSDADIEMTRLVEKAAGLIGLYFVDHVVVTRADHYSMSANGIIDR